MKRYLFVSALALLTALPSAGQKENLSDLFLQLDQTIARIGDYDAQYRKSIDLVKRQVPQPAAGYRSRYDYNLRVAEAYHTFDFDSTKVYLNRNLDMARRQQDAYLTTDARIRLAYLYASGGLYIEAMSLVYDLPPADVPEALQTEYLITMAKVYSEAGNYSRDENFHRQYEQTAARLKQQFMERIPKDSSLYYQTQEGLLRDAGRMDEAFQVNDEWMAHTAPQSAQYATVAFFRSLNYSKTGNRTEEKRWLIRSAISDIQHSIKNISSLITLATVLSYEGDVERSYSYMRTAQEMLQQYNTPLRNLQSIHQLSLIDHNYQLMTDHQNRKLKGGLLAICLLSALLAVLVLLVIRQMRHLKRAHREMTQMNLSLQQSNDEINSLNRQLKSSIDELHSTNAQLHESNTIKETYIGQFLSQCSNYLTRLDAFRSTALRKAKSGQLQSYLSAGNLQDIKDDEVRLLMRDFDHAFLELFPTFIDDFNDLLKPETQVVPANGELLNTELRVFALIRLGITDSRKIADFLHYSVNTVYNYRSKVKNDTVVPREEFEAAVRQIGKIG